MFLQETHLKVSDQFRLHKGWISHVRGVAILVSKKILFVPRDVLSDPCGYVIVSRLSIPHTCFIRNVYAPNWDDVDFANRLLASLPKLNTHQLSFGGDINWEMDSSLDRLSSKNITPTPMSKSF